MKINKEILIAAVILVLIIGYFLFQKKNLSQTTNAPALSPTSSAQMKKEAQTYAFSSVATHNTKTDCWMVIGGKVYDVTSYVPNHNPDIVQGCGKEATALFEGVKKHAGSATSMLNEYLIGTLQN